MDIGTLTGTIVLEDQLSSGLEVAAQQVKKFFEGFGPEAKLAVEAFAVITGGIAAVTGAITYLGSKGADINDLTNTINDFAGGAENATKILEGMKEGTLETVDEMTLMHSAAKLLSSGAAQNAEDFKSLSAAAFVLQNQGYGKTTEMLQVLSSAMVTGRTRQLAMMGVVVDTKKAEQDYARELGKTADELNKQQKLHADRMAIVAAASQKVKEAGDQELDFGERIERAKAKFTDFIDSVAAGVAKSPVFAQMFKGLEAAFVDVFGGDKKAMVDTIVSALESFGRFVVRLSVEFLNLAQVVVQVFDGIKAVILGVETGVAKVVDTIAQVVDKAAGIGAKLHVVDPADAAAAHDYRVQMDAMTDSLAADTKAAWDGAMGHSALNTRLENAKQTLIKTEPGMYNHAAATDKATESVKKHTTALADDGGESDKHRKAVDDLIASWTGQDEKLKVIIDAYNRLTPAQKDSYQVQQALIPVIDKLIEEHDKLAAGMMDTYTAAVKAHDGMVQHDKEILAGKNVTLEFIEEEKAMGRSEAQIAHLLGVSTDALKLYQDELKDADKQMEEARQTWIKFYDHTDSLAKKQTETLTAELQKQADARAKNIAEAFTLETEYEEKLSIARLTGNAKMLAEIDKQERDAIAKLGPVIAGSERLWQKSRDAIVNYYADLRKVQQGFTGDYLRDADIRGYKTKDELQNRMWIEEDVLDEMLQHEKDFTAAEIAEQRKRVQEAKTAAGEYENSYVTAFENIAKVATKLGQTMGGAVGQQVSGLGSAIQSAIGAYKAGDQGIKTFWDSSATGADKAAKAANIAMAAMQGYSDFQQAFQQKSKSARILGGAKAGAEIGTAILPGWGTAIGAGVGALVAWIKGDPSWVKLQNSLGKELGTSLSDDLAKAIDQTADDLGNVGAAVAVHMSDLIKEAGGLTKDNLAAFEGRLAYVFQQIKGGQLTLTQGMKVISDNWDEFAKAGTSSFGVLDKTLVGVIKNVKDLGKENEKITQFVGQQAVSGAKSFGTALGIPAQAMLQMQEDTKELEDAYKSLGTAAPDQVDKIQESINNLNADIEKQRNIIGATAVRTQESADAMAYALEADFQGMLDAGASFSDALAAIAPGMEALKVQMDAAGITGSAVFNLLNDQVKLYSDAVAGPALQSVDALSQGMVALSNMGQLNQGEFLALSDQIYTTFDNLTKQGYDSTTVMLGMRDSIQRMWEEEQQFGLKTDDATQALIDQAVQQGIVGEKHKSVSDQMLDATNKMVDILTAMAQKLGADIPDAATKAGSTMVTQVNNAASATRGATQSMVGDYNEVYKAATAAALGHSPGGIKEITVRSIEAQAAVEAAAKSMIAWFGNIFVAATEAGDPIYDITKSVYDQIKAYQEAPGVVSAFTDAQKTFIDQARQAGVSSGDIAEVLGTTSAAIDLYATQQDDANTAMKDAIGIIGKYTSAQQDFIDTNAAAGVSVSDIAQLLGLSTDEVKSYEDAVKAVKDTVGKLHTSPGDISAILAKPTYMSTGGVVAPRYYASGTENVVPFTPKGTDTVPAMLTPGERVLNVEQNQNYENYMEGPSNADVVQAVESLRADLNTSLPRQMARSIHTALVGLRTAS